MSDNLGIRRSAASRCRHTEWRGYGGCAPTRHRPCRSASSAMTRSSCSRPDIAKPDPARSGSLRTLRMAAAAFAARRASCRATVVAGCSRGRRQRAASRHRPGCRAASQAGEACGSSRLAVPAGTEIIVSTCLGGHTLRRARQGVSLRCQSDIGRPGEFGMAELANWASSRNAPSRASHLPPRRTSRLEPTPNTRGSRIPVPQSASAVVRRLIGSAVIKR